jgi:rhodanese-related sulfurtransferase
MKRPIMVGICWILLAALVQPATAVEHSTAPLDEVHRQVIEGKAALIDVRERRETDDGYLRHAVLLPISTLRREAQQADFAPRIESLLPGDKPLYIHCVSGVRALEAARLLKQAGYDARPIKAGFRELREAGFSAVGPR